LVGSKRLWAAVLRSVAKQPLSKTVGANTVVIQRLRLKQAGHLRLVVTPPNADGAAEEGFASHPLGYGTVATLRTPVYEPVRGVSQAPFRGASTVGLSRQDKANMIEEAAALVAQSKAIVVAEYRGLDVESVTKLRREARKQGVHLRVFKNTLARRAIADTVFNGLADKLVGPLLYGFSDDPVAVAKVLAGFSKSNDKLVIKAGAMANFVMDDAAVKQLATMPSREELLAKLMATMQAPIAQFVRTLNEVPARLVRTVAAVRDAKEAA
jgi:large subunit ribosomal protein L10